MKFVCSDKSFKAAFKNVGLAIDCSADIPVLNNVLLCCGENQITLTGYDLELAITKRVEASTEEDGRILLDYGNFSGCVFFNQYAPADARLHVEVNEKNEITMKNGHGERWTRGYYYEYSEIPEVIAEKRIVMPSWKLAHMLKWITEKGFHKTDATPLISGALFELSDNTLNITCVDGGHAIKVHESVKFDGDFRFALPRKTVMTMNRILKDCDNLGQAEIAVGSENMSLTVDGYTLVSPLSSTEDFEKRISLFNLDNIILLREA